MINPVETIKNLLESKKDLIDRLDKIESDGNKFKLYFNKRDKNIPSDLIKIISTEFKKNESKMEIARNEIRRCELTREEITTIFGPPIKIESLRNIVGEYDDNLKLIIKIGNKKFRLSGKEIGASFEASLCEIELIENEVIEKIIEKEIIIDNSEEIKKLEEQLAEKEAKHAEEKAELEAQLEAAKQSQETNTNEEDLNTLISDQKDEYKFAEKLKNNELQLYYNEENQLEPILKEGMKMKGKDRFGHQVFTREIDINKMIDSIGRETILNPETTILEPTSGDGAFTVRILSYRLEKILNETTELKEFLQKSLISLSTLYSIEYDAQTCWIQRCNLYTVMMKYYNEFVEKLELENKTINQDWDRVVHKILFDNVMWGAFAATNHEDYKSYETILGFDRSSDRPLCITKWIDIKVDKKLKIKYKKEMIS